MEAANPLSEPPPGRSAADEPPGVSSPRFFAALAWLDSLNVDVDRMTGSDHPSGATGGAGGSGPS